MSSAKIEKFARMANQIGEFYAAMPQAEGAEGVANHIRKFWTPKMIQETLEARAQQNLTLNETAAHGLDILHDEAVNATQSRAG